MWPLLYERRMLSTRPVETKKNLLTSLVGLVLYQCVYYLLLVFDAPW